ncbi:uncharacterized protein LOC119491551 [Sebastes umbrosus]|uniref:uncharacterized protein LOC119491551 n=1 Tax=Sebastes umbrosus TaxID=72105 RepID=UPI00189EE528|nr:uncharacterized protein LOC119491551 [Sebastes umbrosus]
MHPHTHQHAFTPILHQSLIIQPAPMFNMHLPRAATRPSFAPVTAFHRATQKPFRSTKRGKWGALHVCIAWKIYYHEQLKKMQQKPNSLHQELTPEYLATCQPDRVQHKGSDQPSCINPNIDSPYGHSAYGNTGDRRGYPSDLFTSSPASCHSLTAKREKLEQPPNLHFRDKLDEKEKHGVQQVETTKDLSLRDKSWDLTTTPEPDVRRGGSLDRKRHLECDGSFKVKRVKLDVVVDDTSKTLHTDPSLFIDVMLPELLGHSSLIQELKCIPTKLLHGSQC